MGHKWVESAPCGIKAQHRFEDLALIAEVVQAHRPDVAIELGTAEGGFAAFLASVLADWGGRVVTFDRDVPPEITRLLAISNLGYVQADLLREAHPSVLGLLRSAASPMLYCDNGAKMRELALYAPWVPEGGLVGVHDYGTEVPPDLIEPLMRTLGYQPVRHEDFAALAHPEWYPVSLTRFWRRFAEDQDRRSVEVQWNLR